MFLSNDLEWEIKMHEADELAVMHTSVEAGRRRK
jgi:hypothetical protein